MNARSTLPITSLFVPLVLLIGAIIPHASTGQSGTADAVFAIGTGANSRIFAMAAQPDGRQVLGGSFTSYNGRATNRLVRITRTGASDNTFIIGTGADGQVNTVAIDAEGRVLVGGGFNTFNGFQRSRMVRLNSAGRVDATFAIGTGFTGGSVTGIAVQADGRIVVVGSFTAFNGVARNRIARLNADGSLDNAFNVGAGANGSVLAVALDLDGRILVGGSFTSINGTARSGLARLTTAGAVDAGFDPGAGFNGAVYCIAVQRNGRVLVGGAFTSFNGSTPAARIARLQTNGSFDNTFTTGTGFNSWVYTIALQGDGKVLAGGDFTTFNGSSTNRLARLNTTGTLDTGFNTGTACSNWVYGITWQPEGRVTVAGGFTSFNGVAYNRLVRLHAGCDENVQLTVNTDAFGTQTSWELIGEGYTYPICSGSGFASSLESTVSCCVPHGPMRLRVLDSAGDGMTTGGYVLRDASGQRIIDNRNDGAFGAVSAISSNGAFYLPMSTAKPILSSCDKLDWVSSQYMVATELPEVSAQFGVGDQTDDGYEFWWYDPDGTYSQRKFRNHATSDGFGIGALRACHQRVSWSPATNPIPQGVLLNIKVRGRVNGVNGEWGPACRFKLDPVAAACPATTLYNVPGEQYFSCGVTRTRSQYITCNPVTQANRYEFEFTNAALGYSHKIQSSNYHRYLNWTTNPLVAGNTYSVRVRASRDGGATFCSWGEPCTVTIITPLQQGASGMTTEGGAWEATLWPNPTTGDRINMGINGLPAEPTMLEMLILDAMGRIVHTDRITTNGPHWQGAIDLERTLPPGQYIMRLAAGDVVRQERFVVAQ